MGLVIKEICLQNHGKGIKEGAWSNPMGRNGKMIIQGAHRSSSEAENEQ
jgi:hypothetical protein